MSCMDSKVNLFKRLVLTSLLILFLIGAVGHAILPNGELTHAQSESACVFHHGINATVRSQPSIGDSDISPASISDTTCALDLAFHISHPPTF